MEEKVEGKGRDKDNKNEEGRRGGIMKEENRERVILSASEVFGYWEAVRLAPLQLLGSVSSQRK
ncbi:MAG: hypothetical protein HUU08_17015 [Candidatus Brocadia sp.]|nr:hypothetical protein [Candidatus Brocadia sp.]